MLRADVTPRSLRRADDTEHRRPASCAAAAPAPACRSATSRPRRAAGLSVLAVICYHAGFAWMRGGWIGVEVFFVVSGFLITSLLIEEREAHRPASTSASSGCAGPAGCCRRSS